MKWISNKTLFNIHGWIGLNLGLLLFVICFSGTFATLSSEVDWLLNSDMRVEKKDAPIQWEKMYQSLKKKYPDGKISGLNKRAYSGRGDHFASVAYVSLLNGQTRKVYLDPYSGNIQGYTSFFNVQRFFRSYHRRFFDGNRGILIITLSSFFLLFSGITGFLFYKGWLKNLFKLRLKQGIKTLFSDAHKMTGIWSLVFTLLIALTGIFYFAELMFQAADNYEFLVPDGPPEMKKADLESAGPNPELLSLDKYVANAKQTFPGLEPSRLHIPNKPDGYVYVDGQAGNPITRDRANKVYLHPFTGEVVHIQRSSESNTAEFITDMADPLHFGYFGGLITKIIWFIFGLAISFAILSGTYLWYVRGMDKMKRKLRRRGPPSGKEKGKTSVAISGFMSKSLTLSRAAVLSTVLVLIYLIFTGVNTVQDGIQSYGPLPEDRFESIQTVNLDSWMTELQCKYPCNFESGTEFLAKVKTSGIPNYVSLNLQVVSTSDTVRMPFSGAAAQPSLTIQQNVPGFASSRVQLVATSQSGQSIMQPIEKTNVGKAQNIMARRYENEPERAYPKVAFGIYAFIIGWVLLTGSVVTGWTWFLIKSTNRQRMLLQNSIDQRSI